MEPTREKRYKQRIAQLEAETAASKKRTLILKRRLLTLFGKTRNWLNK